VIPGLLELLTYTTYVMGLAFVLKIILYFIGGFNEA